MANKKFSLGIVLSAVDKVTGPLKGIQSKFKSVSDSIEGQKDKWKLKSEALGFPRLKKDFGAFTDSLKPIAGAMAVVGVAGAAAFALVKSSADKLDNLGDLSKSIGVNVRAIQEWRYAASMGGSSAEDLDEGMKTFTLSMGKAHAGGGKLLGFLKQVNPAFAKQLLSVKDNGKAFEVMMNAIAKVENPQKRLALATMAFGGAGESLARVAGEGGDKIARMREEARKLGLATEEDTEKAGDFNDKMGKMLFALDSVKNTIAVGLMPTITELFQKMTAWVSQNQEKIKEFALMIAIKLPGAIQMVVNAFDSIINSPFTQFILWIIEKVGAANVVFAGLGVYIGVTLISILSSLVTLLTSLGFTFTATWAAALGPITLVIAAIVALVAVGYQLWKNWDSICDVFKEAWEWVKKITGAGWDKLKGIFGFSSEEPGKEGAKKSALGSSVMNPAKLGASELGAKQLGPQVMNNQKNETEANVKVSFDNLPKGARVQPEKNNTANLDLSMGYSMVTP